MPTQPTPLLQQLDLAARAAEVRRFRAQHETEHPGLVLALSVPCREHDAATDTFCYPIAAGGVCGRRYERAVDRARTLRGQRRSQSQEARR